MKLKEAKVDSDIAENIKIKIMLLPISIKLTSDDFYIKLLYEVIESDFKNSLSDCIHTVLEENIDLNYSMSEDTLKKIKEGLLDTATKQINNLKI